MYRPICLIKALQLNVQQILIWLEMLHSPKNNWFSRVKCIKRPYRHMFFLTEQHTRQKTNVFFRYVHIWPYKKLQTKPVAHDFDETFLRSVSLVTALILKQSNFCHVELNSSMQLRVFGRLVLPPLLTAHLESLTSSKTQIGC